LARVRRFAWPYQLAVNCAANNKNLGSLNPHPYSTMTGLEPVIHGETRLDGRVRPGHGEEVEASMLHLN
jgi:hypothetical protein